MNNIFKLFVGGVMALGAVTCCVADTTDDTSDTDVVDTDVVTTQTVSARMDCKTIKAKIDELKQNGTSDELSRLQQQYRKDCVVRASGLRSSYRGGALTIAATSDASVNTAKTNAMVSAPSAKVVSTTATNTDVKDVASESVVVEISDAQKQMCERLPDFIAGAADDARDTLQATYDEYCQKNIAAPDAVVKTTMMVLGPAETPETDEEKYARIAANLDAGLCPDGTTPNKFGCCGDEKFKDIGNLEFACCPEAGECFPPIK